MSGVSQVWLRKKWVERASERQGSRCQPSNQLTIRSNKSIISSRSLCQNRPDAKRQAASKEEDIHQEVHSEPLLQWILFLWGALWAHSGTRTRKQIFLEAKRAGKGLKHELGWPKMVLPSILEVCPALLQTVQLLVTVVDYDRVGASEPIGQVLLGGQQKGAELRHWSEMLSTPRRPVAQWHTLKPMKSE